MTDSCGLSVVIVTYNRHKDLKECLTSLFNMEKIPDEVIIVDSCSTDGTSDLAKQYPVRYLTLRERSMVKARNLGLRHAQGSIVAYIDDDVVVSKHWSKHLLEPYTDVRTAGVGGRVEKDGVKETAYLSTKNKTVGHILDNGFVLGNFDTPLKEKTEVDSVIGCNMSFRKELLVKAGAFDENFKGNCFRDDTDVCLRLRKLGYKIVYHPKALVWHKYRGKITDHKWYYWTAYNHSYFCLKNFQPINARKIITYLDSTFFPPSEYVRKSGIKIKPHPISITYAALGLTRAIFVSARLLRVRGRG